jgi:hypothetical protein
MVQIYIPNKCHSSDNASGFLVGDAMRFRLSDIAQNSSLPYSNNDVWEFCRIRLPIRVLYGDLPSNT